ncbi:hypothetical protein NIES4101_25560 (plasmid) [Calothrix sp. NIES-4101]|nr:hypothetical protein NIES4101_25560 [Calothrix sp. NIES-4101]
MHKFLFPLISSSAQLIIHSEHPKPLQILHSVNNGAISLILPKHLVAAVVACQPKIPEVTTPVAISSNIYLQNLA